MCVCVCVHVYIYIYIKCPKRAIKTIYIYSLSMFESIATVCLYRHVNMDVYRLVDAHAALAGAGDSPDSADLSISLSLLSRLFCSYPLF